jgi:4-hydroxy-tetrahydrodipicolinate synthase
MQISGVWLPIITPFVNNEIDYKSYESLIDYYIEKGITGIIPLGTTGEVSTIDDDEYERLIDCTVKYVNGRVPIFIGAGGNYTQKVIKQIKIIEKYDIKGILSVSPYYNRPDQKGIYQHFLKISENTKLDIVVYNIPYRTGRNIENDTILKLAELPNMIGIKDSCGDIKQTIELILNKPDGFSVLTGEDILFYSTLLLGGDGGILAAAHVQTESFLSIYELIANNDHQAALSIWLKLSKIIPLLFTEPNPAPIKYFLYSKSMISSSETRLPLCEISKELKDVLGKYLPLLK